MVRTKKTGLNLGGKTAKTKPKVKTSRTRRTEQEQPWRCENQKTERTARGLPCANHRTTRTRTTMNAITTRTLTNTSTKVVSQE